MSLNFRALIEQNDLQREFMEILISRAKIVIAAMEYQNYLIRAR